MSSLPPWLISATLHGSLAILIVWAVGPLLRGWLGARVAYLLWAVVLAHLLLPWLPASPIPWPTEVQHATSLPATAEATFLASATVMEPARRNLAPSKAAPPVSKSTSAWALQTWIAGIAIILGFSVVRTLRAGRLVRRAREVSPQPALQKVLESLDENPARLRIRETLELKSPALCGLWRPTILLPVGWGHRLTPQELDCVLRHEIGHLKRGDLAWRWIFLLARAIHWFNPLVWMAERSARVHQEMACDEWVLVQKNAPTLTIYGETLLALARRIDGAPFAFPLQAGMAESKIGLKRRLQHIAAARPHGWLAATTGLLIAGGFLLLTSPAKSDPSATRPDQPKSKKSPLPSSEGKPLNPSSESSPRVTHVQIESQFVQMPEALASELLESADPDITGVQAVYPNAQFQRILRRLDQEKGIDLMSLPRVTAKLGQRAVINLIREFKYPVKFDAPDSRTPVATPNSFETRNLGVELEVEPTATADAAITLFLSPRVTEFAGFVNFGGSRAAKDNLENDAVADAYQTVLNASGVINQPVFSVRQLATSISLQSGQTVLVGGIQASAAALGESLATNRPVAPKQNRSLFIFVTATLLDARGQATPAPAPGESPFPSPKETLPVGGIPSGVPVPGKPGFVTSPHAPRAGYVDVRGFKPGAEVKDPYSGKMFLVP